MNGAGAAGRHALGARRDSEEQAELVPPAAARARASIVLMYMVLTVLYESWLQPVLILTALPLATVGAFLGLLVFHQTLSVPSFIGLIALFGLVGKNAILLVDRANDLRRAGAGPRRRRWSRPAPHRLRPILMTSAVLILSMLPVALKLGDGGEVRAPLGAVLVGGMATSTLLSLLYVPVAYTYFDSFGTLVSRLFGWRPSLAGSRRGQRARGHPDGPRQASPSRRAGARSHQPPVAPAMAQTFPWASTAHDRWGHQVAARRRRARRCGAGCRCGWRWRATSRWSARPRAARRRWQWCAPSSPTWC